MVFALVAIWVGFHLFGYFKNGSGAFLTPRNLWNLSVQTASIGIMATGMVLVIITRNIDLSVGSIVGVVGMYAGLLQAEWLPPLLGLGNPSIWIIAVVFAIALGALIGTLHGAADCLSVDPVLYRYAGRPAGLARHGVSGLQRADDFAHGYELRADRRRALWRDWGNRKLDHLRDCLRRRHLGAAWPDAHRARNMALPCARSGPKPLSAR
jgi:hypothetical protein